MERLERICSACGGVLERRHMACPKCGARWVPTPMGRRRWGALDREVALTRGALLGPPHADPGAVRRELRDAARRLEESNEHAAAAVAWGLALDHAQRVASLARAGACAALRERLDALCRIDAAAAREGDAVAGLVASGKRREAIAVARDVLARHDDARTSEVGALVLALAVR